MTFNFTKNIYYLGIFLPTARSRYTVDPIRLSEFIKKGYPVHDIYYTIPFINAFENFDQDTFERYIRQNRRFGTNAEQANAIFDTAYNNTKEVYRVISGICGEIMKYNSDIDYLMFTAFQISTLLGILQDIANSKPDEEDYRNVVDKELRMGTSMSMEGEVKGRRIIAGWHVFEILKLLDIYGTIERRALSMIAGGITLTKHVQELYGGDYNAYTKWLTATHGLLSGISLIHTFPLSNIQDITSNLLMELTALGLVILRHIQKLIVTGNLRKENFEDDDWVRRVVRNIAPIYCSYNDALLQIAKAKERDTINISSQAEIIVDALKGYIKNLGLTEDEVHNVIAKARGLAFHDILNYLIMTINYIGFAEGRDDLIMRLLYIHKNTVVKKNIIG